MTHEYPEQKVYEGWSSWYWNWRRRNGKLGGIAVHRVASFQDRGGVIRIVGYGRSVDEGPTLEVAVSDAGQSLRVYLDGRRMEPIGDEG